MKAFYQTISFILFFCVTIQAQVKIGDNPTVLNSCAVLEIESADKGFLLPRVANTAAINSPKNGMMIYDLSSNCIKSYDNGVWSPCHGASSPQVVSVDCAASGVEGSMTTNVALGSTTNALRILLKNQTFTPITFSISPSDVTLTGASAGLSVLSVSNTLNGGNMTIANLPAAGELTLYYRLTGMPTSQGTLTMVFTKANLSCAKQQSICTTGANNTSSTAAIAESSGTKSLVATPPGGTWSVFSGPGSITGTTYLAPDVAADTPVVVRYTLAALGTACPERVSDVTFTVKDCIQAINTTNTDAIVEGSTKTLVGTPAGGTWSVVSGGGTISGATYTSPALTSSTNVVVRYAFTGVAPCGNSSADVTFSVVDCGPIAMVDSSPLSEVAPNNTRTLSASPAGGTWSLVSGVGTLNTSTNLYTAPDVPNNGSATVTLRYTIPTPTPCGVTSADFTLTIYGSDFIFDRAYADANHKFIYKTLTSSTGKIWLTNNLGAAYANAKDAAFNPNLQATSLTDVNAYGSLYQWGRYSDGHEFRNSGTTSTLSSTDTPSNSLFIIVTGSDWRTSPNNSLWQGVNGINNPCPIGFRLPTRAEFQSEATAYNLTNNTTAASSIFKFSQSGYRSGYDNSILQNGFTPFSTSDVNVAPNYSYQVYWNATIYGPSTDQHKSFGYPVRCIKN